MSHKIFSIRIPVDVAEPLEAEASKEVRSLNQQLTVILRERYKAHAPPAKTKSQAHTLSRKQKTKAETA
jgi:hypothetical protein